MSPPQSKHRIEPGAELATARIMRFWGWPPSAAHLASMASFSPGDHAGIHLRVQLDGQGAPHELHPLAQGREAGG